MIVALAAGAPWLAPYDPGASVGPSLLPPGSGHLLGTNEVGQDVASRVLWGARGSVPLAVAVTALALAVAAVGGLGSGLVGGRTAALARRLIDVTLAVPRFPLLIVVGAFAGGDRGVLVVVLALLMWAPSGMVLHQQGRVLRSSGYVRAARQLGAGWGQVLRRHGVPALAPTLLSEACLIAGGVVLVEAGLAFLGVGDPSVVSWGLDMSRALALPGLYYTPAWLWLILPAGAAVSCCVGSFTALGVGLEPLADRRLGEGA